MRVGGSCSTCHPRPQVDQLGFEPDATQILVHLVRLPPTNHLQSDRSAFCLDDPIFKKRDERVRRGSILLVSL